MRLYLHGCLITLLLLFFCTDAFAAPPPAFDGWTVDSATTTPIAQTILKTPSSSGFLQQQVDAPETTFIRTIIPAPILPPATITGNVTDAVTNNAISGISVSIYNSNGELKQTLLTNNQGVYSSGTLSPGDYYVKTEPSYSYISKLHYNRSCISACDVTTGTVVSVVENGMVSVNFALDQGGLISGTVTDSVSGEVLQDIRLYIYDASGIQVSSGKTDTAGQYISTGKYPNTVLPSGTYYIKTSNTLGYLNERYNNYADCLPCDITTSTAIIVSHGNITTDINFALEKGARISGTVTDVDSGEPLQNILINISDSTGAYGAFGWTDAAGRYVSDDTLLVGRYFVSTINFSGYMGELYNGETCIVPCDILAGTPVIVTATETTADINFTLKKGGQISGMVTNADSGESVNNISLYIYDANGSFISYAWTDSTGNYTSQQGLPTGLYYMSTGNSEGYLNERYDDQTCITYDCDPTSGTAISVNQGEITTNIDFSLVLGGRISGTITDAITGQAPEYITVNIFNADGTLIDSIGTSSGQYTSSTGLPTGRYYAHTDNQHGYINERYSDQPLAGSGGITNATPIQVTAPEISNGIDFSLENGSRISGSITASPTDSSFNNAYLGIEIFDSDGDPVSIAFPDSNGDFLSGAALPPGNYYVLAYDTQNKLASKLYGDVIFNGSCAAWQRCDVTMGTPVTVTQDNDSSNINFSLSLKINNDPDSDTDNSDLIDDVNSNTSGLENGDQENNGDANGGPASLSAPLLAVLALALLAINTRRWRRHSRFFVSI